MYKKEKLELSQALQSKIQDKNCAIVLSHQKITFAQIDKARRMSENGTVIIKIKNKIAQKAFNGSPYQSVLHDLKKENIFIFGSDVFETSKIAKFLEKEVANTNISKAASTENPTVDLNFIAELAALGSKENLQSKLLSVISEVVKKTLRVIDARCEKLKEGN